MANDMKTSKTKKGGEISYPSYKEATVRCACGNEFITRSTKI